MSLRTRLVLAAAYLLTAVVLALEIPLGLNVQRRAESEFRSDVLGRTALLAAQVSDLVAVENRRSTAPTRRRLAEIVGTSPRFSGERVVVTDAAGAVLADSAGDAGRGELYATADRPEFGAALTAGRVDFRRRFSDTLGHELQLVTVPVVHEEDVVGAVRVSASTASVQSRVRSSWLRLALIGAGVVAGGLVLAWLLAGTLARPLARLAVTARRLGRGDLDARVEPEGAAEVSDVGRSFNAMADALAANLAAQRDFVANASHQLRTPLTGIKLRLENIRAEGGAVARQAAGAEAELDRLSELVDDLLELTRASTSSPTGHTVDAAEAARAAHERWRAPAAEAGKELELRSASPALVWADAGDLAHVFDNLVENALRYAPDGTRVTIEAERRDGHTVLAVADDGPGIPPQDRARIFERFYRGSTGRRAGAGTGLGLAIVAELVERWGGDVRLGEGDGTRVEAAFPEVRRES